MNKKAGDRDGTDQHDDLDDLLSEQDGEDDEDLDDDDADGDDDDLDEDDDDADGADDDQAQGGKKRRRQQAFDMDEIMQKVESRIDKRLNVILREIRGGNGQRRRPAGGAWQRQERQEASVADVREARLSFRDYLSDEVTFTSPTERRFAADLGAAMIRSRALDGFDDGDAVGREVAEEVAKQVKAMRRHYQKQTIAALRRRGALADPKAGQGGSEQSRGGGNGQTSAQFADGQALAAARHSKPDQSQTGR